MPTGRLGNGGAAGAPTEPELHQLHRHARAFGPARELSGRDPPPRRARPLQRSADPSLAGRPPTQEGRL
eukprot:13907111-Alexandrium_andersonii.AAC.1